MHEMGVTRSLVDQVVAEAERVGAESVRTVFLRIGFGRDIVDEILDGCFKWMARGTVLEGCELVVERVPFTVRCNRCGLVYPLDVHCEETWDCPCCHTRDYRLNSGMEFQIAGIEASFGAHRPLSEGAVRPADGGDGLRKTA